MRCFGRLLPLALAATACATSDAAIQEIRMTHGQSMTSAWKKYEAKDYSGARAEWEAAIAHLSSRDRDAYLDGRFYLSQSDALSRIGWTYLIEGQPVKAKAVYEELIREMQTAQRDHQSLLQSRHDTKETTLAIVTGLLAAGADVYSTSKGRPLSPELIRSMMYTPDLSRVKGPKYLTEDGFEGDGTRMPVTATIGQLRFLGRLRANDGRSCTGAVVGWRLVLTAAHCVTSTTGTVTSVSRVFIIDNVVRRTEREVIEVHTTPSYTGDTNWAHDWALLVLDQHPYRDGGWLGVLSPANARQALQSDSKVLAVAGYSSDINQGRFLTLDWGCSFSSMSDGEFRHRCTYWKGASGAPVLLTRGPYLGYVVAVAAGSALDKRSGVAATTEEVLPKLRELKARFPQPSS